MPGWARGGDSGPEALAKTGGGWKCACQSRPIKGGLDERGVGAAKAEVVTKRTGPGGT